MRKISIFATICAFLLLQTGSAFAAGCGCGTIRAIVSMTEMKLSQQITGVNTTVKTESRMIQEQILQAAMNIIGTMKTDTALIIRAIQDHKESTAETIKGVYAAMEAKKSQDMWSQASMPQSLCDSENLGAGIQLSGKAQGTVKETIQQEMIDHMTEFDKQQKYLDRLTADSGETGSPSLEEATTALFPTGRTMTPQHVKYAAEAVKTITNPLPARKVTESQEKTLAGETYTALRNIHEMRVLLSTEAISKHIALHSPTLPSETVNWATQQWNQSGAKTPPPGIVDGKMSDAALYNLLSQIRIGNPSWNENVKEMNDSGLLRELVMMQAVQLEMTRQNNELLDRISVGIAMQNAILLEKEQEKLNDAYRAAIGAQQ